MDLSNSEFGKIMKIVNELIERVSNLEDCTSINTKSINELKSDVKKMKTALAYRRKTNENSV